MPGKPRPLGLAVLLLIGTSCASPCIGEPPGYARDTRAYNLAHGRVVFTDKCMRCHESGRKGAPVFGDTADWADRLTQPLDTLIAHAIGGHGRMPARGDQDLSDQDVAAAVAYVVNRLRVMAAARGEPAPGTPAQEPSAQASAPSDYAVMQMFLLLIGKDQWR